MIADLARRLDAGDGDPEELRQAIVAELERVGTAAGVVQAFDLPWRLRMNREGRVKWEEDRFKAPRRKWETSILAALLVAIFMHTAAMERVNKARDPAVKSP